MDVMEHRALVDLALQIHDGDAAAAAETCRRAADWWERFAEGAEGRHQIQAAVWRAVAEHLEHLAASVAMTTSLCHTES